MRRINGEYCLLLSAIAKKNNFSILITLLKKGSLDSSKIMDATSLPKGTVLKSLRDLGECRYIFVKTKGNKRIYQLNRKTVMPLLKVLGKHIKEHNIEVEHGAN